MNISDEQLERLTPEARNVLYLAQEEAGRFDHTYLGTEHLLLGLVRLERGVSATVFKNLGVELNKVRSAVEFIIGRGEPLGSMNTTSEPMLTPRAQTVIDLAIDEARRMDQDMVGPEHILLGLVREGEGIAAGVLESLGVNLERVRRETLRGLGRLPTESEVMPAAEIERLRSVQSVRRWSVQSFFASSPVSAIPPIVTQSGLIYRYQPWHIDTEQPKKTAVGNGAVARPIPLVEEGIPLGTLLGWVVVNTGGTFTLTLYDGLAEDVPALAIMHQPPTGTTFSYHCLVKNGLAYTLEGSPGSITIVYQNVRN